MKAVMGLSKKWLYGLIGLLLGLGAPVGSFLLRLIFTDSLPAEELSRNGFFYLYMLLGTCIVFSVFGLLIGLREDEAMRRIEKQGSALEHLTAQMEQLTSELRIRCQECEIVRNMENQVLQAEKLATVGRFAASVAHEVNNPLMGIKNALAIMTRDGVATEKKDEYRCLINEGLGRIEETVRSLLQFAKQQEMEKQPVDLWVPIKKALSLCEAQLRGRQIMVDLDGGTGEMTVLGDERHLQQVFLNLFINSYDAMERGGMVTVRAYRNSGRVLCEVNDTGRGISRENLPHVFDPFFTTKAKGTGLGLSVCRSIVEKHGGEIRVESQLGLGTTFRLSFPAWQES